MKYIHTLSIILLTGCTTSGNFIEKENCSPRNLPGMPNTPLAKASYSASIEVYEELNTLKSSRNNRPKVVIDVKNLTLHEELYLGKKLADSAGFNVIYSCNKPSTDPDFILTGEFKEATGDISYTLTISDQHNRIKQITNTLTKPINYW